MNTQKTIKIGIVSIYDKQDDFNFEIVNFPFHDGDLPMVYLFHNIFILR